jgi:hypothetical protein
LTRIRTTHPRSFRSGEWATLRGTASLPTPGTDRACYMVEFDDGTAGFWPVRDPAGRYEFAQEAPDVRP